MADRAAERNLAVARAYVGVADDEIVEHAQSSEPEVTRRAGAARAIQEGALWVAALSVTGWLAYLRWRSASASPVGSDFGYYMAAARNIVAGKSPYLVKQYTYPPALALLLAPFAHVRIVTVWKVWIAIIVAAPFIGVSAFLSLVRGPTAWWLRPLAFGVCGFTLLCRYYPMSRNLVLGQSDTILFSVLVVSAVAASRAASRFRGAMIGLAGLIKVWPWSTALEVLQTGTPGRRKTLLYGLTVALVAPLTALAFGWSGLIGFVKNTFDARQQDLVSDTVWCIPHLLFSRTGLARAVVVSPGLEVLVTVFLVAWVLGLVVFVLRSESDGALATWNLLFCIILLLPVSHRQYAILVLPLLWWWSTYLVTQRPNDWRVFAVVGLLGLWWLNQTVYWPYNGSSHKIASLHFCVPFFADLVACTASVLGIRLLGADPRSRKNYTCEACGKRRTATGFPAVGGDLTVGECRACLDRHTAKVS
jgi:hypothetical protein